MNMTAESAYRDEIIRHYRRSWPSPPEIVEFRGGPLGDLPSEFRIVRFDPSKKHGMWTYATVCMSQPYDPQPLELHLFAPEMNDNIAELLAVTAHYHRTGSQLGLGHSVNFGRPWWNGSLCDHGLISLPYLNGPSLEWLLLPEAKVRFLWVIPVTTSEIEIKLAHGLEALDSKFEETRFNYLNPGRKPVI